MARYRKVDTRIWNDEKVIALSDDAQLLFMFLMTHPHSTSLGAFRATIPGLAAERRWTEERCRTALGQLTNSGMVQHDETSCFVALPNFLKYNNPESPNVIKSWLVAFDLIPECPLKTQLLVRMRTVVEGLGEGFRNAFGEAFGKALPKGGRRVSSRARGPTSSNQEQELEQDPQPEQIKATPTSKKQKTDEVEIPAELDTPQFHQAWSEWLQYRRERKEKSSPTGLRRSLIEISKWGPERAVAAVYHSIANNWKGIFEPKAFSNGQPAQPDPMQTLRDYANIRNGVAP